MDTALEEVIFRLRAQIARERDARASAELIAEERLRVLTAHNSELAAAREQAEAGSRAASAFLANISHEIRTPLSGILGLTELILETDLSGQQREYLDTIHSVGDSLLAVISNTLDFARIEAGKLEINSVPFSLVDLIESTVRMLAPSAAEKNLELSSRIQPQVPEWVIGDPDRIRQVLVNLIGNATKFTAQGEVAITVELESQTEAGIQLHLSVRDTGIGIAGELLSKIFDAFTLADVAMTRRHGGAGMSLSISKSLVNLMDGRLWVDSAVGIGSTFHCTLPLGLAAPTALSTRSTVMATLFGLSVLVIDDHVTNRRILEETLSHWGMQVTVAESGAVGLALLQQTVGTPYALVVLDRHMPNMDGFAVAQYLQRARKHTATPPILMLTSSLAPADLHRSRALGIAAHLSKPIRRRDLLNAICQALDLGPPDLEASSVQRTPQAPAARRARRILLVEDNPINQMVAKRFLAKLGHEVLLVETGLEAVHALERAGDGDFDLVLMDMQIDIMDGIAATAAIRELHRARGSRHLPIVAMTAHALPGDRGRCLAAGMDEYLPKPIPVAALARVIEQLTRSASDERVEVDAPTQSTDAPSFRRLLTLFQNDRPLLEQLMAQFIVEVPQQVADLKAAVARSDVDLASSLTHSLKGTLGYFDDPRADAAIHLLTGMLTVRHVQDGAAVCEQLADRVRAIQAAWHACAGELPNED